MKSYHLLLIALLSSVGEFTLSSCDNGDSSPKEPLANCSDGFTITTNEGYLVINNQYGAKKANLANFSQCVYYDGVSRISWNWDCPLDVVPEPPVKSYPEIIIGKSPFREEQFGISLPAIISSINSLTVSYKASTSFYSGEGNLAFDLWITDHQISTPFNRTTEIMIWEKKTFLMFPNGWTLTPINTTINGIPYSLYHNAANDEQDSWHYFAFIPSNDIDITNRTIQIKPFIDFLLARSEFSSYITSNNFIATLEFGNEVVKGRGETVIQDYLADVNINAVPTQGLVAYYPFNGNANDESGNQNQGTIHGTLSSISDRSGNPNSAYSFTGNNFITVPDAQAFHFNNNIDFTYTGWIKYSNHGYPSWYFVPIIFRRSGPEPLGASFGLLYNKIASEIGTSWGYLSGDNGGLIGTTELNDNQWHFVALVVTRSNQNAKLYVDDRMELNLTHSSLNLNVTGPETDLYIGLDGRVFQGAIDDIRIYNRALTSPEILQLYNGEIQFEERDFPLGNSNQSVRMVKIPTGTFLMGSPSGASYALPDEFPQHSVTVSQPYWIGKYEITQSQWQAIMANNPSTFVGSAKPVDNINWTDAQSFISQLNTQSSSNVWRLPSESEWEYACRAGTTARFTWGEDYGQLVNYAWIYGNSGNQTHPTGLKLPNPWGLCDMYGNVSEWCQDWYHSSYSNAPTNGSAWMTPTSDFHVMRGGTWLNDVICRSSARTIFESQYLSRGVYGLRLVGLVD